MNDRTTMPTDSSSPYRVLIRVRYAECDAQQVVFNARYGDYVDVVVTEYFRDTFGGYESLLAQGIDGQVVRLTTDWQSPAKFDDVISISIEPLHIGNSSYSFVLHFTEYHSQRAIATSEITYVMVTPNDHQKMAIPDFFREKLVEKNKAKIINFAGIEIE